MSKNKSDRIADYLMMKDGLSAAFSGVLSAIVADKVMDIFKIPVSMPVTGDSSGPPVSNTSEWLILLLFIVLFIAIWAIFLFVVWPFLMKANEYLRRLKPHHKTSLAKKNYFDECMLELANIKREYPLDDALYCCIAINKISKMLSIIMYDTLDKTEHNEAYELKQDNTLRTLQHFADFRNYERRISSYSLIIFYESIQNICNDIKNKRYKDELLEKDIDSILDIAKKGKAAVLNIYIH